MPRLGNGGYRLGKFDLYWVRILTRGRRKRLLIYRQRKDGSVARWEF